jgi:hypothetical protein
MRPLLNPPLMRTFHQIVMIFHMWVEDPYWFVGQRARSRSINTDNKEYTVLLNISKTLWLANFKLSLVYPNYWFWGQGSNWTHEYTDHSIYWETFTWQTSNLIHWYILKNQLPLLILRSRVKLDIGIHVYWSLNILRPFAWQTSNVVLCTSYGVDDFCWFWGQNVKGQTGHRM